MDMQYAPLYKRDGKQFDYSRLLIMVIISSYQKISWPLTLPNDFHIFAYFRCERAFTAIAELLVHISIRLC
jgi:hypothetical protein